MAKRIGITQDVTPFLVNVKVCIPWGFPDFADARGKKLRVVYMQMQTWLYINRISINTYLSVSLHQKAGWGRTFAPCEPPVSSVVLACIAPQWTMVRK